MPISITLPAPGGVLGWKGALSFASDFIGPLPTGSHFRVLVSSNLEPDGFNSQININVPTTGPTGVAIVDSPEPRQTIGFQRSDALVAGSTAHINVLLQDGAETTIDSGSTSVTWQPDAWLTLPSSAITSGGLTPEQDQSLTEIHAGTFTDQLIDNLTLIALTTGPSPGPINTFLTDTVFGVIIRLATIPAELEPGTPDGDYWGKTLCVVRIFRGSDLWMRYPIHTSNRFISFVTHDITAAVAALTATQWLLNMSMQVTFLPGVTGEVFLTRFP